jgi:murein DD-endopeptidase MepM/ murein hydrolase activator NlpD
LELIIWIFIKKLGMEGHNGIDFRARNGCPVLSAHEGVIRSCGTDSGGGVFAEVWSEVGGFKTIYYHLLKLGKKIQKGVRVGGGELIGLADNTGKYTTGSHLHFGLKEVDKKGFTKNTNNGYFGAIDPTPYFENRYGKDWWRPAAYHRYGRKQEWLAEFKMRFKNKWLHRQLNKTGQLKKVYDTEFINMLVYGGWSFDETINPAMYENNRQSKKRRLYQ